MNKHLEYPDTHHDPSANTLFGFWVYLMTDFILFATLFATYAVLHTSTFNGPTAKEIFHPTYALGETLVLLTSSFTTALGMVALFREEKTKLVCWFSLTFLLGLLFLSLVGIELNTLLEQGISWRTSAFLSAYFTLVGTHGLHILLGLFFLLIFLFQLCRQGLIPVTIRRLTCLSMFWYFSYIIWVFMFAFVYLIGAKS